MQIPDFLCKAAAWLGAPGFGAAPHFSEARNHPFVRVSAYLESAKKCGAIRQRMPRSRVDVLSGPRFWGDIVDACELLVDHRVDNPLYDPGRGTRLPQRRRLAVCGSCGHISARIRHCRRVRRCHCWQPPPLRTVHESFPSHSSSKPVTDWLPQMARPLMAGVLALFAAFLAASNIRQDKSSSLPSMTGSPVARQHPFGLGIGPIQQLMISLCLSALAFASCNLPLPLRT